MHAKLCGQFSFGEKFFNFLVHIFYFVNLTMFLIRLCFFLDNLQSITLSREDFNSFCMKLAKLTLFGQNFVPAFGYFNVKMHDLGV